MKNVHPAISIARQTLLVGALMLLGACSSSSDSDDSVDPGIPTVAVTSVSASPEILNLDVGESSVLSATVTPANATITEVAWSSSDPTVATVSATGVVSAVSDGASVITVTTTDGAFTDTTTVNVAAAGVAVTGVSITPTEARIDVGGTTQLNAVISPANATDKTVVWNSSDTDVATVSASGLVTGVAAGTSSISVTTIDGGFAASANITVTVAQSGDLTIHSADAVAGLIAPQGIDLQENMEFDDVITITSRLYELFNDDFDFIFIVTNSADVPTNVSYFGRFYNASNAVEGIGRSISDNTASFGSSGRLKGVIHLPYRGGILNGPSLHELAHNWANHFLDTGLGSHWGFTGFVGSRGQLGGFDSLTLQDLGGGTYTADPFGLTANGGNSVPYSNLELYLMGMIDVSQAMNVTVVENGTFVPNSSNFTADSVTEKSFAQIMAEESLPARNPPAASSQKNFRILTVVASSLTPTEQELGEVNAGIQRLAQQGDDGDNDYYTFNEATQFAGTLTVDGLSTSLR